MGMWGEINKGIQQVGATGMGLLKEQNDEKFRQATLADSQARLNMAQAAEERNKLQFEHAEKKRLEQEAQENAYVPASMLYPDITNDKNTRKNFIETAKSAGYDIKETADGDVHAQGKAYKYIQGLMTSNAQFRTTVLNSKKLDTDEKLTSLEQQSVRLAQEIMAARDSGKEPQKIAEMEAKQKQIRLAMSGVINSSADIQKTIEAEVRKQEQAKELKQMEVDKAKAIRESTEAGLDKRAEAANASREKAAGIKASAPPKASPSNERLEGKEKTEVEAKLLNAPEDAAAPAYAARYNELSTTDEYVKQTKVNKIMPDETTWVKQPKGKAATPVMTAKNKKGLVITSSDGGKTWKDSNGKVIK